MSRFKIKDISTGKTLFDSVVENRQAYRQKETKRMSNIQTTNTHEFTSAEIELIKSTVAKGASNDELKLFLYRCKHLGLDPLKPGQIHFVKYGTSPGTIVVGIEGLRVKASRTSKHSGTQRGILRDSEGHCMGAWCEVSRADWTRPAREEVSLHEYDTGKGSWVKLKETMIKKVAEAAALRMAFPDDLSGVYVKEEMDQAEPFIKDGNGHIHEPLLKSHVNGEWPVTLGPETPALANPGSYVIAFGKKYKGQMIRDIDVGELGSFIGWCDDQAMKKGQPLSFEASQLKLNYNAWIDSTVDQMAKAEFSAPKFEDSETIPF